MWAFTKRFSDFMLALLYKNWYRLHDNLTGISFHKKLIIEVAVSFRSSLRHPLHSFILQAIHHPAFPWRE